VAVEGGISSVCSYVFVSRSNYFESYELFDYVERVSNNPEKPSLADDEFVLRL
jgi:hypothetical protein